MFLLRQLGRSHPAIADIEKLGFRCFFRGSAVPRGSQYRDTLGFYYPGHAIVLFLTVSPHDWRHGQDTITCKTWSFYQVGDESRSCDYWGRLEREGYLKELAAQRDAMLGTPGLRRQFPELDLAKLYDHSHNDPSIYLDSLSRQIEATPGFTDLITDEVYVTGAFPGQRRVAVWVSP